MFGKWTHQTESSRSNHEKPKGHEASINCSTTFYKYRYGPHGLARHWPPNFESQPGLFHFIRPTLDKLCSLYSPSISYHLMKLLIPCLPASLGTPRATNWYRSRARNVFLDENIMENLIFWKIEIKLNSRNFLVKLLIR